MTQDELFAAGIYRFRRPMWADEETYAQIDVIDGLRGPWLHLWNRDVQKAIGEPTPQNIINIQKDLTDDYVPYTGPRDPEDKGL